MPTARWSSAVTGVDAGLEESLDRAVCGRRVLLDPADDAASLLLAFGLSLLADAVSGDGERRDGVTGSGVNSWRSEMGASYIDRALGAGTAS
jgi:hypothetical protein